MTADQLRQVKEIREELDEIRGNDDLVESLQMKTEDLISEGVQEAKDKIDSLVTFKAEEDLPF